MAKNKENLPTLFNKLGSFLIRNNFSECWRWYITIKKWSSLPKEWVDVCTPKITWDWLLVVGVIKQFWSKILSFFLWVKPFQRTGIKCLQKQLANNLQDIYGNMPIYFGKNTNVYRTHLSTLGWFYLHLTISASLLRPLASLASWKNVLSIASMSLTDTKFDQLGLYPYFAQVLMWRRKKNVF